MTSLMRAKTRAEPEVIYYLLQVQERAFGEGCIELRCDLYTVQPVLYAPWSNVGWGRAGGGVGVGVPFCLSLLVVTA